MIENYFLIRSKEANKQITPIVAAKKKQPISFSTAANLTNFCANPEMIEYAITNAITE